MATTVWKGHLTFGLVSIPVRLHRAARAEKVSFRRLSKTQSPEPVADEPAPRRGKAQTVAAPVPEPELSRVKQAFYAPDREEEPIPQSQLVRGYEYAKDRYVVVEEDELKNIAPKTSTEMQIVEFVRFAEIDPVYLETSYYMSPDEAGERAYALLFEALRKSGYAALARVAMHRREHVMALRPGQSGILTHTLYYADEVRKDQEFRTDASEVSKKELDLALLLVESLADKFEPSKYRDTYRDQVRALIETKVAGREVAEVPAPRPAAQVVDILKALQQSLEQTRKPPARASAKQQRKAAR